VVVLITAVSFIAALTYVLNLVSPPLVETAGTSKPVIGWEEFIDILQVGIAACAFMITPGLLSRLSDRVRGKIIAECRPIAFDPETGARAWRVFLRGSGRELRDVTISLYPKTQGNLTRTSRVQTDQDGGLMFRTALARGCLELFVERFAPSRCIALSVLFARPDTPAFYSKDIAITAKFLSYEEVLRLSGYAFEITRLRVSSVLLVFVCLFGLLCARVLALM
jgi:hypothetical protein